MNATLQNKKVVLGGAAAAFALVVIGGWLLVVSPERAKATDLASRVDAAQSDLTAKQAALRHPAANVTVRASDGYRLATALPERVDMSGVILDVQRLASKDGLEFISILPQAAGVAGSGFIATPVAINVQGRFGNVSNFLGDLRTLVRVRHGRLETRGRLYSVGSVGIGAPQEPAKFPVVLANVTLNTYAFSAPAPAPSTTPSTPSSGQSSSTNVAAGETP